MKKTDLQLIAECLERNIDSFGDYLEDVKEIDRGEADFILEEFMNEIDGMDTENIDDAVEDLLP